MVVLSFRFRFLPLLLLACIAAAMIGCGESRQDLFMKHASRTRPDAGEEEDEKPDPKKAVPKPAPKEIAEKTPPPQTSEASPAKQEEAESADPDPAAQELALEPIDQRKPEEALDDAARRKRSIENMQKIFEALEAYRADHNGYLPERFATSQGGLPTVSWRVKLLPYLGYEALYNRFDLNKAWNRPPNKDLLQFIPDEYVSPERFDTKTNYLVPATTESIFDGRANPDRIQDGAENTILMFEVDDKFAVNWTEPKDIDLESARDIPKLLGNLREEGAYAMWASGLPFLLENGADTNLLMAALTPTGDEGFRAVQLHRPVAINQVETNFALDEDPLPEGDASGPEVGADTQVAGEPMEPAQIEEPIYQREPVPPAIELTKARDKLRRIYSSEFSDAKTDKDKNKLATELLATAADMESDPAGAYVLQGAALRMVTETGEGKLLVQGIDQRVARFDIDSLQENLRWYLEFGEKTASKDDSTVEGDALLQRSIPVIFTGIREDEYMYASAVARIANRFTGNSREDKVSRLLTRLRTQLGVAKRQYDDSVEYLQRYRTNPDDREAAAAFGRFLCFIKGDWSKGLELIMLGRGSDLVEVARLDLQGASRAMDQVAIADAWWELSLRGSGPYRQGAQDRAVRWYKAALERLPDSLDRIHVENRLQEAEETDGTSPIALCRQLADELRIDLSASLTTIAVEGLRGVRGRDDDDDD